MKFREFKKTLTEEFSISEPKGTTGPEIADIQKLLTTLGYALPKHGVDGIMGPETKAAISAFQKDAQIKVDGFVGPETAGMFNAVIKANPELNTKLVKSTAADVKPASKTTGSAAAGGAAATGDFKSTANKVSPAEVKSYLLSKGLDENQTVGILANIKHESGFQIGVLGDNGTSGGLFQHHDTSPGTGRFTNMIRAVGKDWQTNWRGQIDFALTEPAGKQYASTKFATPEDATKWWTVNFEVPANKYAQADLRSRSVSQFA